MGHMNFRFRAFMWGLDVSSCPNSDLAGFRAARSLVPNDGPATVEPALPRFDILNAPSNGAPADPKRGWEASLANGRIDRRAAETDFLHHLWQT